MGQQPASRRPAEEMSTSSDHILPLLNDAIDSSTAVITPSSPSTPSKPDCVGVDDAEDQIHRDVGFGSVFLNGLPPTQQMIILGLAMFLFFGMHNVLQEAIVTILSHSETSSPANTHAKTDVTIMLGYAEVIGVLIFSYLERIHIAHEPGFHHVAPLSAYPLLTLCLFASSSLSNMSLSYINFPTKVVFRTCKLVPTMIIATIVNKKVFASYEYACAFAICTGLVLFALADYTLDPLKFDIMGLMLVSGSVVADSILPNAQEHLFREGSSRLEVTVFSNLFTFVTLTVMTFLNGVLGQFMKLLLTDSVLTLYFGMYTLLSYISISCYMTLVKRFGGVTAVLLTTARKAMTLILSFLLFPKGFSWLYVHGSLLVLGAVMIASIFKKLGKKSSAAMQTSEKQTCNWNEREEESRGRSKTTCSSSSDRRLSATEEMDHGVSKRIPV